MDKNKIAIGNNIRRLRKDKGISQRKLAEKLDISFQYLSKWERGLKTPSGTNIIRIADALGVNADEILSREEKKKKDTSSAADKSIESGLRFSRKSIYAVDYEQIKREEVERIFEKDFKANLTSGFLTSLSVKPYVKVIKKLIEERENLKSLVDALKKRVKDLTDSLK